MKKIKYDLLISVLSWEDRFLKGLVSDLNDYSISNIIIINHYEMKKEKNEHYNMVSKGFDEPLEIIDLPSDPIKTWNILKNKFSNIIGKRILVDITTMRRETIWAILSFLRLNNNTIDYIYYKPGSYNEDWLSREPDTPRLLFKHSGISKFGYQTALLILTGFDADRTRQLVNYYEPELTILGSQIGNQFQNDKRNDPEYHISECKGLTKIKTFCFNSYEKDHGFKAIKEIVEQYIGNYNLIVSSQGPKISAISLYNIFIKFPDIALSYVPCKLYNKNYSTGISEPIYGNLKF